MSTWIIAILYVLFGAGILGWVIWHHYATEGSDQASSNSRQRAAGQAPRTRHGETFEAEVQRQMQRIREARRTDTSATTRSSDQHARQDHAARERVNPASASRSSEPGYGDRLPSSDRQHPPSRQNSQPSAGHPASAPFPVDRVFDPALSPTPKSRHSQGVNPLAIVETLDYARFDAMGGGSIRVHFMDLYYPKGRRVGNDEKRASRAILSLKDRGPWGVSYWAERVRDLLEDLPSRVLVVPAPGSEANDTGSADRLEAVFNGIRNVTFGTRVLERVRDVPKSSGARSGGYERPSIERHLQSIECSIPSRLRGLPVLLIDDVLTQGNTIVACHALLTQAGAVSVTCLCLAKTANRIPTYRD